MAAESFKEIIERDRQKKEDGHWEGTCLEYLEKVKENPKIAQLAPGRLYNIVISRGTEEVAEEEKLPDYGDLVRYRFFQDELFGIEEPLHDIVKFLGAGARRTETGKRILILVGPVASGKSTIVELLKRGLENDPTAIYAIKGCPMQEEPLHLIPQDQREKWSEILGVHIEGELCPRCRFNLLESRNEDGSYKYRDEEGRVLWEEFPVERIILSEQARRGIGTFQPSDPKNQDISELIGRVDLSKITQYGETDPRAYRLDGELEIANRGLIEYVEILKCDIKFHYMLITAAQEQVIKAPGFPQLYTDTVIISHTNQTEFDKFKSNRENEALHDRMYPVFVPYTLKVDEEQKIYEKLIQRSEFRDVHIAPYTLKTAAMFAVLTRLEESDLCPDLIKKMKYYNGEIVMEEEENPADVKELRAEGKKKGEGMSGISPRFVINALNVALEQKTDENCINPIDVLRALRGNFAHHIGFSEEQLERYRELLLGDKASVTSEYKEIAKREVNRAFLMAYEDQAQSLFDNYIKNARAYCLKKKLTDPVTGEEQGPDEKLMRSIEERIGVSENAKDEFRQGVFVFQSDILSQGKEFSFETYKPLQEAIEKKLIDDLEDIVSLTIADKTKQDPKTKKRRQEALESLKEKGYCESCADSLLQFVGELLHRQE